MHGSKGLIGLISVMPKFHGNLQSKILMMPQISNKSVLQEELQYLSQITTRTFSKDFDRSYCKNVDKLSMSILTMSQELRLTTPANYRHTHLTNRFTTMEQLSTYFWFRLRRKWKVANWQLIQPLIMLNFHNKRISWVDQFFRNPKIKMMLQKLTRRYLLTPLFLHLPLFTAIPKHQYQLIKIRSLSIKNQS